MNNRAARQLPASPQIDDGQSVTYKTNVLGCEVSLLAQANAFSISVAEAVLGSIEAFFATSLNERILPYRQSARIILRSAFNLKKGLVISEETEGAETHLVVLHPVSAPEMTTENRMTDRDGLMEVIARFILHIAVIEDSAEAIGSEYQGRRAGNFGDASVFSFHGSKTLTTAPPMNTNVAARQKSCAHDCDFPRREITSNAAANR